MNQAPAALSKVDNIQASIIAQAKMRIAVAMPITLTLATLLYYHRGMSLALGLVFLLHISYIITIRFLVTYPALFPPRPLAYATALLDSILLSIWLPMLDEYGGLIVGFYLFTILGFGFRIGPQFMRVCQLAALIGFTIVLISEPFWQHNFIVWLSFFIMLIVVPLYATVLIKKLHEARAHAERESQAKSTLLAKVSHELRTPLSGIVTATQLLAAETDNPQTIGRANAILGLSNDLLREINDLLDQSKYEAQALVLDTVPLNFNTQLEKIQLTLGSTAHKKGLKLHTMLDPRITDWVLVDSHYLSRVLINIAGNAVKFTDQGSVNIDITLLEENENQYHIRFSVQDTGIGIPEAYQTKIFEPFFQITDTHNTARRSSGTGLGMAIAKELVNLMGGNIYVESKQGQGSLFYFELDLPRISAPQVTIQQTNDSTVYGKRIFIADDNETILLLIKELLEKDQHIVTVAKSGAEALKVLSENKFDALFLDFNLGDMNGDQVLQMYRFGTPYPAPAYFLTADATRATTAKLRDTGAVGVLNKPIMLEELRSAIAEVCPQQTTAEGTAPLALAHANASKIGKLQKIAQHATLSAVPSQALDQAVIDDLRAISNRPDFLRDLLTHAYTDIERTGNELLQSITDQNSEEVRDAAHALKGVSTSIGATRLARISSLLMRFSHEKLIQIDQRTQADLKEAIQTSLTAIRRLIDETQSQEAAAADPSRIFLHTD